VTKDLAAHSANAAVVYSFVAALKPGAQGSVLKELMESDLPTAVRSAADAQQFVSSS
jgi:DNA-binding NarL/FixJ family response regulator